MFFSQKETTYKYILLFRFKRFKLKASIKYKITMLFKAHVMLKGGGKY